MVVSYILEFVLVIGIIKEVSKDITFEKMSFIYIYIYPTFFVKDSNCINHDLKNNNYKKNKSFTNFAKNI